MQQALANAQTLALEANHSSLEPAHLLLAMLEDEESGVAALLRRTGANADNVAVRLRDTINNLPTIGEHDGIVQASRETGRLINLAYKESRRAGRFTYRLRCHVAGHGRKIS